MYALNIHLNIQSVFVENYVEVKFITLHKRSVINVKK